jgi:ribA/ribD-fused uncharacterized protein
LIDNNNLFHCAPWSSLNLSNRRRDLTIRRFSQDAENWMNIMLSADPANIKKYGRAVQNYDDEQWAALRFDVVTRASLLKFAQHADLRQRLLDTGNKWLVEASPFDAIWGIKASATDKTARCPQQWRGQNLLGIALTITRDSLRNGALTRHSCLACSSCTAYVPAQYDPLAFGLCQVCFHHSTAHAALGAPLPQYPPREELLNVCTVAGCFGRADVRDGTCRLCRDGVDMNQVWARAVQHAEPNAAHNVAAIDEELALAEQVALNNVISAMHASGNSKIDSANTTATTTPVLDSANTTAISREATPSTAQVLSSSLARRDEQPHVCTTCTDIVTTSPQECLSDGTAAVASSNTTKRIEGPRRSKGTQIWRY